METETEREKEKQRRRERQRERGRPCQCKHKRVNLIAVVAFLQELNLAVVGSQIVGIVPLKALMDAADYFMKRDNLFILEEDQKLRLVRLK